MTLLSRKHRLSAALGLGLVSLSAASLADGYGPDRYGYGGGYGDPRPAYDDGRAYAEVLDSRPIYREVQAEVPHRECYQQPVTYADPYEAQRSIAGTLLGGLIGGVVGHQFGGGSGRVLATAAGAVIGAGVGNHVATDGYYSGGYGAQQTGYESRCNTQVEYRPEQRIDGYDVTYRYDGRVYHTRLPYDPGSRLAVNVNVAPASGY